MFPAIISLLSQGFVEKVWKEDIRPCQREFLDGKVTGFRHITGQLANVAITCGFVHYTLVEASLIGLNPLFAYPIAAFVGFLSLWKIGDWLDSGEGNEYLSLIAAGLTAGWTIKLWMSHGFIFGHLGSIAAGVLAGAIVSRIFVPLLGVGLTRLFSGGPRRQKATEFLGNKVNGWHKSIVDKAGDRLLTFCKGVYEDGYSKPKADEQLKNFRLLVLHLTNIGIAGGVFYGGLVGTSALLAAWHPTLFGLQLHGLVAVAAYGLTGVATVLSYSLVGHAILEAGFEIFGFALGMVAGVWSSVALHSVQPQGWLFAGPIGLVVLGIVFGLVAPAIIQVVQGVGRHTPGWILVPLTGLEEAAFKRTVWIYTRFQTIFDALHDLVEPIVKILREIRDAISGKSAHK